MIETKCTYKHGRLTLTNVTGTNLVKTQYHIHCILYYNKYIIKVKRNNDDIALQILHESHLKD